MNTQELLRENRHLRKQIEALREALAPSEDLDFIELGLTRKETRLYKYLKERTYAKKWDLVELLGTPSADFESENLLKVYVCKLRKKLPKNQRIENIWGVGYRLVEVKK